MFVGLKRISAAVGLLAATAGVAQAQGVAPVGNQSTADAVASSLRQSRALSGYRIEIETRDGVATLTGTVATAAQKAEAIARAQRTLGVVGVADQLTVGGDNRVRPVQYQPQQVAMNGGLLQRRGGNASEVMGGGEVVMDGAASQPGMGGMMTDGGPVPEGAAGMPSGVVAGGAGQPNYAWPSYAPYPNYSAVGYPTAYPWQAWPNIGPPHPYPEVPLDWRAVTLRWDDGIWWLDFKKNYTRPFFTPYPFGIAAY